MKGKEHKILPTFQLKPPPEQKYSLNSPNCQSTKNITRKNKKYMQQLKTQLQIKNKGGLPFLITMEHLGCVKYHSCGTLCTCKQNPTNRKNRERYVKCQHSKTDNTALWRNYTRQAPQSGNSPELPKSQNSDWKNILLQPITKRGKLKYVIIDTE